MRVIIAGGRDFNNYELLKERCDYYLKNIKDVEIVSGTANGTDILGEKYASDKSYPLKQFPADWNNLGRGAGYKRNAQMAEYADALIAFWNGKSKGTKHMIDSAKSKNLKVRVVRY